MKFEDIKINGAKTMAESILFSMMKRISAAVTKLYIIFFFVCNKYQKLIHIVFLWFY